MNKSLTNILGNLILLLFSVFPFFGFFSLKFIGKSAETLTNLLAILCAFLFLYETGKLKFQKHTLFLFFFFIYVTLSDIFIVGEDFNFLYIRNNSYLGSILILIIIDTIKIENFYHRWIFKFSIYTLLIAFVVTLIQQVYTATFFTDPSAHAYLYDQIDAELRLPSIYTWVGPVAEVGISFFPVLGFFIEKELLKNKNNSMIFLFFIGAIVSFLSKMRFAMLNYLILFLLVPLHKGYSLLNIIKYTSLAVFLTVGLYFGAKAVNYDVDTIINDRILDKDAGGITQGTAGTRILAFQVFAKLFPENPIWGKGKFHQFGEGQNASRDMTLVRILSGRSSQIHVGYLSLFYYYGLVGGTFYIIFLVLLTKRLIADAKITNRYAPLFGWIMFLLTNMTGVHLDILHMGIIIVLYFNKYYLTKVQNEIA